MYCSWTVGLTRGVNSLPCPLLVVQPRLESWTGRYTCSEAARRLIPPTGQSCWTQRQKLCETFVPMSDRNEGDNVIRETLVMDNKVYAEGFWSGNLLYYSPCDRKWGRKKTPRVQSYYCVIENLLYGCDEVGNVFWRESGEVEWKKVKGLEALRDNFPTRGVRGFPSKKRVKKLSSFGVNIAVFWVGSRWDVWCAEISMERRKEDGEIWGTFEWSEAVTTLDHAPFSGVAVEVLYSATVNV